MLEMASKRSFYFFLLLGFFCNLSISLAQIGVSKPVVDTSAYLNWQNVSKPSINSNGLYVSYVIDNCPIGSWTLIIKSVKETWQLAIPGGRGLLFTEDGRFAVFSKSNDSLFIAKLGSSTVSTFSGVRSFRLAGRLNHQVLVMRRSVAAINELQLYNFNSGHISSYKDVEDYAINSSANSLIIHRSADSNNKIIRHLDMINLKTGAILNLWNGSCNFFQMIVDASASQISFIINDSTSDGSGRICFYYKVGSKSPSVIFSSKSKGIDSGSIISGLTKFSKDGCRIFFSAYKDRKVSDTSHRYVNVNIWSYLDPKLHSLREQTKTQSHPLVYSFNLKNKQLNIIGMDGDVISDNLENDKASFISHVNPDADPLEHTWNTMARHTYFYVSTADGKRVKLDSIIDYQGYVSPSGRYVVFFNGKDYYSYDVALDKYRNITSGIDAYWLNLETSDKDSTTRGICAWLREDDKVLVYDKYDIWLLDPSGRKAGRNITNAYGKRNNIVFNLGLSEYDNGFLSEDAELVLSATGLLSKKNGFYKKDLHKIGDPTILTYGPYVYNIRAYVYVNEFGQIPIKSSRASIYMVSRMSATESLNYFVTSDFQRFIPVSNIYPEKNYNWYTTELHTWTTVDGTNLQGVLYKPENFDSTKRYPIILTFYEKLSANLNVCLIPGYSSADINIPTYVSNGYLMFTPDITYKFGDAMQGAYNSVTSAAQYLSALSFVDNRKMAIYGFSFGAVQTNYLIANTNMFVAACSGSGLSDLISEFGAISIRGHSLQNNVIDGGQNRMSGPPWEVPDMYIKNSPIFKANKVNTPLLMMHTTWDGVCPFSQALEFFTALRRLNKKVWLLEYTDGHHSLTGHSAIDFDRRMRQFFDHYLKDAAMPGWMQP